MSFVARTLAAARRALVVAAPLLVLGGVSVLLGAGAGCGDDDLDTGRSRNDGGAGVFLEAGGEVELPPSCPESIPKIGENCTEVRESQVSCTYVVGVCQFGMSSYNETVNYCCPRGGTWALCGANTTPCDNQLPEAGTGGEIDGPAVDQDAGADAPDA